MEKRVCSSCAYYLRHYTMNEQRVFRVFCGHCTQNGKRKRPDQAACESFKKGKSQEKAFPNKEYLSKFLLKYMAKLEILPEIYESDERIK